MWERGQGGVGCGEQEVTDLHIGASAGQHPFHDLNALHRQGWCAGAVKAAMRGEGGAFSNSVAALSHASW